MYKSKVYVLKTSPETVLDDYGRLLEMAGIEKTIDPAGETLIKLNLSWTKYFPACSSQPWQVEGVLRHMTSHGYDPARITGVENKTVVTDPWKGAANNKWLPVLGKYGVPFQPLTEVEWTLFKPKRRLLKLDKVFPEGILIPKMFNGRSIIHLPTVKTHGHSTTTGAIKNAFGGLLKEVRHYCHKYIHEVLVDLMILQREIHPGVFAVMDGTVAGDGAGPRTMIPRVANLILASDDSVAIDSVAAKLMGFDPMKIEYLKLCDGIGLGIADPGRIEIVGDDVSRVNLGFETRRSLVIWGDQMIRKGPLQPLEHLLLHTPLVAWAPFASNVYHDMIWYPTVGKRHIDDFSTTGWGRLFETYQ